jgi:dTDP-4-dehydrorhamnose reductase
LLGAHIVASLSTIHRVVGVDRNPWWGDRQEDVITADLSDLKTIEKLIANLNPEVLVHTAGLVDVDMCEKNPQLAYAVNAGITRDLVRLVSDRCRFIYISTDSVFRGDRPFSTEEQATSPRSVYSRSKLQGEWEVEQTTGNHLIVRSNFFGWSSGRKRTFAEWLYSALESEEVITLFDDYFFTPLYVVQLVGGLNHLIEQGATGRVHVAGKNRVSKFEFGRMLAETAGFSMKNVRRASIDESGLSAPRSKEMSLNCDLFQRRTGVPLAECAESIRRFVADRSRPLSQRCQLN